MGRSDGLGVLSPAFILSPHSRVLHSSMGCAGHIRYPNLSTTSTQRVHQVPRQHQPSSTESGRRRCGSPAHDVYDVDAAGQRDLVVQQVMVLQTHQPLVPTIPAAATPARPAAAASGGREAAAALTSALCSIPLHVFEQPSVSGTHLWQRMQSHRLI